MSKITKLRIKGQDGTFANPIDFGAKAINVIMDSGQNLQQAMENIVKIVSLQANATIVDMPTNICGVFSNIQNITDIGDFPNLTEIGSKATFIFKYGPKNGRKLLIAHIPSTGAMVIGTLGRDDTVVKWLKQVPSENDVKSIKDILISKIRSEFKEEYEAVTVVSGYWNTTSGIISSSSEWIRSASLVPFFAENDTIVYSTCGYQINIACFDENLNIMDSYATAPPFNSRVKPRAIPAGTYFLGMNIHNTAAESISIARLKEYDIIEYPFENAYMMDNYWVNGNGNFSQSDAYSCLLIPVKPGEKYYTNATLAANFLCYDKNGGFSTSQQPTFTQVNKHGRIYTIPNEMVYAYINIPHNKTHGNYSTVVHKITRPEKILCIGDSITWLDGEQNTSYDGASLFLGWQKKLTRLGYQVVSAGYSGYAYAVDGTHSSIYTQIVTNNYNVSGYDVIILAGGTNDDLYGITVGDVPANYNTTHDPSTVLGALAGLISYIRTNNSTCKIVLCTPLKSESTSRPYSEAKTYAEGIRNIADYASCYLIDCFRDFNIQPFTNGFNAYFYDTTHPNKDGMARLGGLISNFITKNVLF